MLPSDHIHQCRQRERDVERFVDIGKYSQLTFDELRTRERIANDLEGGSVVLLLLKEII